MTNRAIYLLPVLVGKARVQVGEVVEDFDDRERAPIPWGPLRIDFRQRDPFILRGRRVLVNDEGTAWSYGAKHRCQPGVQARPFDRRP